MTPLYLLAYACTHVLTSLLLRQLALIARRVDPDLLLGWDVRRQGLGFALERADALAVSPPLIRSLGRTPEVQGFNERREDAWGVKTQSGIHLVGRIVLNVWRCARNELQLCSYSLQVSE